MRMFVDWLHSFIILLFWILHRLCPHWELSNLSRSYTVDTSGGELFSLEVKDLLSEHVIFSSPNKGVVSLAWSSNSESLFDTVCDETLRPNQ
jgi:protease II